jgi:hypothetical protein
VAGYYGFKFHAAVCTTTGLPVAWTVRPAGDAQIEQVPGLLDNVTARGFTPDVAIMDKGYDASGIHRLCAERCMRPVIPLKMTVNVVNAHDKPPTCAHGVWTFAGADAKRGASTWRCPTGACTPGSVWVKADRLHPLIPRSTDRYRSIYRERVAVEREFGVLKHRWALLPHRVRRLSRVALHVDVTILARLAEATIQASVPAAA